MHIKIHNSVHFKVWLIIYISFDSYICSLSYRIKFMFQSLLPVTFWNTAPKRPGDKKSRFEKRHYERYPKVVTTVDSPKKWPVLHFSKNLVFASDFTDSLSLINKSKTQKYMSIDPILWHPIEPPLCLLLEDEALDITVLDLRWPRIAN